MEHLKAIWQRSTLTGTPIWDTPCQRSSTPVSAQQALSALCKKCKCPHNAVQLPQPTHRIARQKLWLGLRKLIHHHSTPREADEVQIAVPSAEGMLQSGAGCPVEYVIRLLAPELLKRHQMASTMLHSMHSPCKQDKAAYLQHMSSNEL